MASEYETLLGIERQGDLNPVQRTRLEEYKRQQPQASSFSGNVSAPTTDYTAIARQMLELQKQANQPAIQSLEASIPETSARFATEKTRLAGEKEPLKQRYQNLLDEITRREKVDVSAQEQVTSREFGRRGIPLSSGLFDVELQEKLSPLRQFYTGQTKETGLAREEGLTGIENLIASLSGQETETQRNIRNAMAQLQAGGAKEGISGALNLYQLQQQAQQNAAELALKKQVADAEAAKKNLLTLGEGSSLYDPTTGKIIATAPKTYKPEETTQASDLEALRKILSGEQKTQPTSPPSYFVPMSTSKIPGRTYNSYA